MRLAELSERSGVPIATIKYYLREGLLPAGHRVSATTADYDEGHLRRLRLVRALIQVGGLPVTAAREVLRHIDDDSLSLTMRLGAAMWALPGAPEPDLADDDVEAARAEVDRLLDSLGWQTAHDLRTISPPYRSLVVALATLRRLGYDWDSALLRPYAELMHQAAVLGIDIMESAPSESEKVESAVAGNVLLDPALQALYRLAQQEETVRRYGF
ncbi:MerR family transcriptional regulator [Streptomyces sp. T-3]|nr:MerR family transcriptional regulator [Streptomyces sp. T-3]